MDAEEIKYRHFIAKWSDRWDMLHNCENPNGRTTFNPLVYTSEHYLTLAAKGWLKPGDRTSFETIVNRCWVPGHMGLLHRGPEIPDQQQGVDDYIAVTTAAKVLGLRYIAEAILQYGLKNKWFYNNVNPGSRMHPDGRFNDSAWFERYLHVIAHFYWCTGDTPDLARRTYWALSVGTSAQAGNKDHDGWILTSMLVKACEGRTYAETKAANCFLDKRAENFPGGMSQLYGRYFANELHPLAQWGAL